MGKKSRLKQLQSSFIKKRCEYQIKKILLLSEMLNIVDLCDKPSTTLDYEKIKGIIEIVQNQITDRCFRIKRILEESDNSSKLST